MLERYYTKGVLLLCPPALAVGDVSGGTGGASCGYKTWGGPVYQLNEVNHVPSSQSDYTGYINSKNGSADGVRVYTTMIQRWPCAACGSGGNATAPAPGLNPAAGVIAAGSAAIIIYSAH